MTTYYKAAPAVDPNGILVVSPPVEVDRIVLTVLRADGARFEITARNHKPDDGYLVEWSAGADAEFIMLELVRRANEHYEAEQRMVSRG